VSLPKSAGAEPCETSGAALLVQLMPVIPLLMLGALCGWLATAAADAGGHPDHRQCLSAHYPQSRSDLPALLNCLGLLNEAVEVGVQAGVHASSFLGGWRGRRLRLVDKWSPSGDEAGSQMFYVDIANIHGPEVRRQHRAHCEVRLAEALRSGRAEIVELDSAVAASRIQDGELDFVYLDARHDFAGVVADIRAWWPKVRVGGVFAGHDFVDGEFPEGDFFWISALRAVLPGLEGHTHVTQEQNRYPSFFVVKTEEVASLVPKSIQAEMAARRLYAQRSRYFRQWQDATAGAEIAGNGFEASCRGLCGTDCKDRAQKFTPTQTVGSTLRPFACRAARAAGDGQDSGEQGVAASDVCAAEMVLDVHAYLNVCGERCNVTCQQRSELFSTFGADILSV